MRWSPRLRKLTAIYTNSCAPENLVDAPENLVHAPENPVAVTRKSCGKIERTGK